MASFDVMPDTQLYQPVELIDALELAARLGESGWLLGGGQDTYGWLKDRAKNPQAMIDLNGIEVLKGIRETTDGVEIGAVTTLRDIIRSPLISDRYRLLSDAAARVASPQIRNVGTLGGNLVQDTRCWYYRRGLACYRAGGNLSRRVCRPVRCFSSGRGGLQVRRTRPRFTCSASARFCSASRC
jgi:xanthine dehydrogenase YagS FAD-binding subunit